MDQLVIVMSPARIATTLEQLLIAGQQSDAGRCSSGVVLFAGASWS
jgi:hypothetical protein